MKVNGESTKSTALFPAPGKPLTFKRGDGFIGFYAQPVWDLTEFHALCPPPENNYTRFTKNGKEKDPEAPAYLEALGKYQAKRWGYVILKSLEPSKDLGVEWENVSLEDPDTWDKVEKELRDSLGLYEFAKVLSLVDEANAIDEAKLEENAESFFLKLSQSPESEKNSPKVEAESSS